MLFATSVKADSSTTTDLLWPLPRSVSFGSTVYSLDPETFAFTGTGKGGGDLILKDAFARYIRLMFVTPAPFYPSGGGAPTLTLASLNVDVSSADETLGLDTNETCEYKAVVNKRNEINYNLRRDLSTYGLTIALIVMGRRQQVSRLYSDIFC